MTQPTETANPMEAVLEANEAYQFFMRPDPNQRKFLGEILQEEDAVTGTVATYRMARIGMTRNAAEEDMTETKVYLGFDGNHVHPHIRLGDAKPLQGWYQPKHNDKPNSRPRPCFSEAMLTQPYGGYCPVGCKFCYINSGFRGYRGSGLITVPMDYGSQVAKQLDRLKYGTAGYFSSFTDPFTELEEYYHNSQAGAEAFAARGLPVFFLSRKSYPDWAFDLLQRNPYSYAQKSLNTGVDADFHKLSPGALSLSDHIGEVRQLRKAGIYTSIQVNPVVPGITSHDDILTLFERLAEVGNNHVIVKFVEAGYSWAPAMLQRLTKSFGSERAGEFAKLFTENQPGSQRTIAWEYRQEAHEKYRAWATRLGMTYATCYEYRRQGKKVVSVGRAYTTAAQCHGQRVPMFERDPKSGMFREVVECPPSGCLYCADDNDGKARCGVDKFGKADALRMSDYRNPSLGGIPIKVEGA